MLAGPAGVGKTRLARAVADAAAGGRGARPGGEGGPGGAGVPTGGRRHLEWGTATAAGATIPLAPFSHLLDQAPAGPEVLGPTQFAVVRRRLGERASGRPVLLVVDDAHLLDDASAALVLQLARTGAAAVVATVRARRPCPDAVVALWRDGDAVRIELQPLTRSEIRTLLEAVLDGPVTDATVDRLVTVTRGNTLFLRELVLDGLRCGRLREAGGWWSWAGPLPVPDRLFDLVEVHLGRLAPPEREAAELVALAEPVGWSTLVRLASSEAVEGLAEHGVVDTAIEEGTLTLRLAHPLIGEVLRGRLGDLRRRRLVERLADALAISPAAADQLRRVIWLVELDRPVPPGELLAAARRCALVAPDLARRLTAAAARAGAGTEAAVVAAQTEMFAGRGDDAEAILAAIDPGTLDPSLRVTVAAMRANNLTFGLRRPADGLAALDEGLGEATRPGPGRRSRHEKRRARVEEAWRRGQRIPILLLAGRLAEVRNEAEALLASEASGPADRVRAWIGLLPTLALTGRPLSAIAAAAEAFRLVPAARTELPHAAGQVGSGLLLAHHWAGEFEAADRLARAAYDLGVADDVALQRGVAAFHLGLGAFWRGRFEEADGWFTAAVDDLGPADLGFLPSAVDHLRAVRALLGRDPPDGDVGSRLPLYETERLRLDAVVAAAAGDQAEARRLARAAAEAAEAMGAVTYAVFCWVDVARSGDARAASRHLGSIGPGVEGPLAALLTDAVGALATSDADRCGAASDRLAAAGLGLHAAEWAAAAACAHRRAGRRGSAAVAAERAARLGEACGHPRTPLLRALQELDLPPLTAREREVAALVAAGAGNAEVARRLGVSVRTVETHLQRAYTKLGVHNRRELGALFAPAPR